MSQKIRLLAEVVANRIAAGEVVERPASVVKELVENSLDAGARQIEITVERGGRSLIRVTDDGCGMGPEDALLALERHATSKIREAGDLMKIQTFGFRGEALPSIASVSRFTLKTREPDAVEGTEVVIDGGKVIRAGRAGCPSGTSIEVRQLFSHVPGRRKFLRTEETEWGHIEQGVRLAALARPEVGWVLRRDGAVFWQDTARGALEERMAAVFGRDWRDTFLEITAEEGGMRLHGYIGRPGINRATRAEQILFVNSRPVQSGSLNHALLEGYHNALMRGRYPVTVLFLEMDPCGVDVNVHPAKREVRFRQDGDVRRFVAGAVAEILRGGSVGPLPVPTVTTNGFSPALTFAPTASQPATTIPGRAPVPVSTGDSLGLEVESAPGIPVGWRFLGVVDHLYLVAEKDGGVVLVDQHAAHERILFEQLLRQVAQEEVSAQRLLYPVTLEFPPLQASFLKERADELGKVGLGISPMGGNSFLVDALPPRIRTLAVEEFVRGVVADLEKGGTTTRKDRRLSEEVIAKTVCRHAVKANDRLNDAEAVRLLADLLACELPYTCPHGRPTMILWGKAELEKKFGRAG
ncbi:MAG: DNA mismatch repair endonuclease MutL [Verrucomicrobia bacterium]|nr:DNA mismatch repair endonuclease MutL [Verrucomicrobiota bacterium]